MARTPVVLDLDSLKIRVGFAGTAHPSVEVPTPVRLPAHLDASTVFALNAIAYWLALQAVLRQAISGAFRTPSEHDVSKKEERLYEELSLHLSALLGRGMLVRPWEHRLILTEATPVPPPVRHTIIRALLTALHMPSVLLLEHPLCSAVSCGLWTACVVDVGAAAVTVQAVAHGRLLQGTQQHAVGGAGAVTSLCSLLLLSALLRRLVDSAASAGASGGAAASSGRVPSIAAANVSPSPTLTGAHGLGTAFKPYGQATWKPELLGVLLCDAIGEGGGEEEDSSGGGAFHAWCEAAMQAHPPCASGTATHIDVAVPLPLARLLGLPADAAPAAAAAAIVGTAASLPQYTLHLPASAWSRCGDVLLDTSAADDICAAASSLVTAEAVERLQADRALRCLSAVAAACGSWRQAAAAVAALRIADTTPLQHCIAAALKAAPIDCRKQLAAAIVMNGSVPGGVAAFGPRVITAVTEAVAGPCTDFRCLTPLLPLLKVANLHLAQHTAFAGASTFAHALANMPRLVPLPQGGSAQAQGQAQAQGSTQAGLIRTDALALASAPKVLSNAATANTMLTIGSYYERPTTAGSAGVVVVDEALQKVLHDAAAIPAPLPAAVALAKPSTGKGAAVKATKPATGTATGTGTGTCSAPSSRPASTRPSPTASATATPAATAAVPPTAAAPAPAAAAPAPASVASRLQGMSARFRAAGVGGSK